MNPWAAAAILSFAVGLSVLLVSAGWHAFPWLKARKETKGLDVEYALLVDEFGGDGLWP